MKTIFVTMLLVGISSTAMADDSFYIQKDGKNYLCQSTTPGNPNPGGAADCVEKAYAGPFSKDESMTLCQGARDVGPAECALKVYNGPFSKSEALELCKTRGTIANADCALKAYAGPYSKAESIKLCKADPHSVLRVLNTLEATDRRLFYNKNKALE